LLRYLINEAKDKLGETLPESLAKSVSIKKVAVPEQPNFCDCGLYLIHAFKTFFSKPKRMMRWILVSQLRPKQSQQDAF
jgi:Ulp1 family protease